MIWDDDGILATSCNHRSAIPYRDGLPLTARSQHIAGHNWTELEPLGVIPLEPRASLLQRRGDYGPPGALPAPRLVLPRRVYVGSQARRIRPSLLWRLMQTTLLWLGALMGSLDTLWAYICIAWSHRPAPRELLSVKWGTVCVAVALLANTIRLLLTDGNGWTIAVQAAALTLAIVSGVGLFTEPR